MLFFFPKFFFFSNVKYRCSGYSWKQWPMKNPIAWTWTISTSRNENGLSQVPRCTVCCKKESLLGIRLSSFPFPPRIFKRTVGQDPFVRASVCGNTGQVSASRSSTVCRWNSFVVTTMTSRTGKRYSPNRQRSSGIIAPYANNRRWWMKKRKKISRRHLDDTMHRV